MNKSNCNDFEETFCKGTHETLFAQFDLVKMETCLNTPQVQENNVSTRLTLCN